MIRYVLIAMFPFLFASCFFKFNGTDSLYYEGKKAKPTLEIKRIWCSQCGCEAIEIKQMEKKNVVYEMLLNCTANCPPNVKSYKIEREYSGNNVVNTRYYFLVKDNAVGLPLTNRDTAMIGKLRQFKNEAFYQRYCTAVGYSYNGYIQTNKESIVRP